MEPQTQADVLHRLRCIKGYLRCIIQMVEVDRPYLVIIQQGQAVQGALRQNNLLLAAEYLGTCLKTAYRDDDKVAAYQRLRDELLALWVEKDRRRR